ncbi:MAG TPA: efflux RND transporter periplasmic adaptor subunit [Ktedonobacterales bacterium]|nr:efflux RND transporter periplasmic adaptor subunit [Ktedonobacterales bacterium]
MQSDGREGAGTPATTSPYEPAPYEQSQTTGGSGVGYRAGQERNYPPNDSPDASSIRYDEYGAYNSYATPAPPSTPRRTGAPASTPLQRPTTPPGSPDELVPGVDAVLAARGDGSRWSTPAYAPFAAPAAAPADVDELPTAQIAVAPAPTHPGPPQPARTRGAHKPTSARRAQNARRRLLTRIGISAAVVLVLIAGIAYGAQKFLNPTPKVQLYVVKNQELTSFVGGGGLTYPAQALDIIYPVSATVETVNVQVGQAVKSGQALITLNSADLTSQLQQALASYQAAQNYLSSLYASGASASLIAQAQSQVTTAKGRYDALNAQLSSSTYSNGNIIAPFAGVITAINVVPGSTAPANSALLTLQNESSVVVRVQLPLEQRAQVQVGQNAEVDPDATPSETFPGLVSVINPALTNVGSDTFEVWITVSNPNLQLLVGESIYARISVTETLPVVPELSVINPDSDSLVFVYSHGRAHARSVIVGVRDLDRFGIVSGLTPGEQVILVGQYQLSDNEPVKVTGIQQ